MPSALLGSGAAVGGLWLALHHPLWPAGAAVSVVAWAVFCWWRPRAWLAGLPAVLPLANLSPWTGWIAVDEFDLLVLGVLAAGHLQHALAVQRLPTTHSAGHIAFADRRETRWLLAAAWLVVGIGLLRGWAAAGSAAPDWYDGYDSALNGWRVAKPMVWALALGPLLQRAMAQAPQATLRRVAAGMVAGLVVVSAAAVYERAAYPGLFDFAERYRIVALFWELHVGGAAIDVYLALAMPFAVRAVLTARGGWRAVGAGALAVFATYATLTTFSRGAYLGVGLPAIGLLLAWSADRFHGRARTLLRAWLPPAALAGSALVALACSAWLGGAAGLLGTALSLLGATLFWGARGSGGARWRRAANAGLVLVLATEAVAVLGPDTFMQQRVGSVERDFGGRFAHWRQALALLHTPADLLLGIGTGRLPSRLAASGSSHEFPGRARRSLDANGRPVLELSGPATASRLAGLFGVSQRISMAGGAGYRIVFDARAAQAVDIAVFVCEWHLLYAGRCQTASLSVGRAPGQWRHHAAASTGARLTAGPWYAPRRAALWLTVETPGGLVQLDHIELLDADGRDLLRNGRFERGMAHWLPLAIDGFLPWHADNLVVETLVEHGALGLTLLAALLFRALRPTRRHGQPENDLERRFFIASSAGVLLVGLVSSVLDAPRTAFLFCCWIELLYLSNVATPETEISVCP